MEGTEDNQITMKTLHTSTLCRFFRALSGILTGLVMLTVTAFSNQIGLAHTTVGGAGGNVTGNFTTIDHPDLNGNPALKLFVSQEFNGSPYEKSFGVFYSGGRWRIYNEDRAAMIAGVKFQVVACEPGAEVFNHLSGAANIVSNRTRLDHPLLNGKPNAKIVVMHDWTVGQTYHDKRVGVWYDGSRWSIYNEDRSAMSAGVNFNVSIDSDGSKMITHDTALNNIIPEFLYTQIDHPDLNGNPNLNLVVTHDFDTNGPYFEDVQLSMWYAVGKWNIVRTGQDFDPGSRFQILVAGRGVVQGPDIAMGAPDFTEGEFCPGDDLGGEATWTLSGEDLPTSFRVGWYLSEDAIIDPTKDTLLSTQNIAVPNGSASGVAKAQVGQNVIPVDLAEGSYYIGAYADDNGVINETNEGNNVAAADVFVQQCQPDLEPGNFSVPAIACAGEDIGAGTNFIVVNKGDAAAGAFTVAYYLSANNTFDGGDTLLVGGRDSVGGLGTSSNVAVPAGQNSIPDSTTPGNYFIIVVVDELAAVAESNEANNTAWRPITINPCQSDLTPGVNFVSPPTACVGENIAAKMNFDVSNIGDSSSGAFKVSFYLSPDPVFGGGDTKLGGLDAEVGNLTASANVSAVSVSHIVPESTTPGDYFLIGVIDQPDSVNEQDEGNNVAARPIKVAFCDVPPIPIDHHEVSSTIAVELDDLFYGNGDSLNVVVKFGGIVPTEATLPVVINSPTTGDTEVLILDRQDDGRLYATVTGLSVRSPAGAVTEMDGILDGAPDERFSALFYVDSSLSLKDRFTEKLVTDFGIFVAPEFASAPVRTDPGVAMSADELTPPAGGKRSGTLMRNDALPVQIALDELVFFPTDGANIDKFLARSNGTVLTTDLLPDEQEAGDTPSSYLVRVQPSPSDLACLPQMRALFAETGELIGSNDEVLETYALALKYQMEGFVVGVNPRLQLMGVPSVSDPSGLILRPMTRVVEGTVDTARALLSVPECWAFMALWDFDERRIPIAILDNGFAPTPDYRVGRGGTIRECLNESVRLVCEPGAAFRPGTVGNGLFGPRTWHGSGVMTVACGTINNTFGGVGVAGQVGEPMLYNFGHISYVFGIGRAIRQATLDGASVINISAGYPCTIIDRAGINFNICSPLGRTALCTAVTATLSASAAAICSTVPLFSFFPPLAAAAQAACFAATTAVVTASSACYATLVAGDVRGPMERGVNFAVERGVPVVASAGNKVDTTTIEPPLSDIINIDNASADDWMVVPGVFPNVISVGACQNNFPFGNLHYHGPSVDFWAPISSGYVAPTDPDDIASALRDRTIGGTSAAAPYITGVIANMQAIDPTLNRRTPGLTPAQIAAIPARVRTILSQTAYRPIDIAVVAPDGPAVQADTERRNLINPIGALRRAAEGLLPDFASMGYDVKMDFDEDSLPDAADLLEHAKILPLGGTDTGTIVNILGANGSSDRADVDWYKVAMPAAPVGLFKGIIKIRYPRDRGNIVITTPGFEGPFLSERTELEEEVTFRTPRVFQGVEVPFEVGGIAGSDNVYKITFDRTSFSAAPRGDRFDRDDPAVNPPESRPNNDDAERAVHLGQGRFPWVRTPSVGIQDEWQINVTDLNIHTNTDTDWFDVPDLPPISGDCAPELTIEFGPGMKLTARVVVRGVAHIIVDRASSPASIPRSYINETLEFFLEPTIRETFVAYDLDLILNQASSRACIIEEEMESWRGIRELFGSRRLGFPRFFPDMGSFPENFVGDIRERVQDGSQRVTTPDNYLINVSDSGNFRASVEVLVGLSLEARLLGLDGTEFAMGATSDLFASGGRAISSGR